MRPRLAPRRDRVVAEFKDTRPGMKTSGFGPENFAEVKLMRRLPK